MRLDIDRPSHPLSISPASFLIGWFPEGNKFSEKKQDLCELQRRRLSSFLNEEFTSYTNNMFSSKNVKVFENRKENKTTKVGIFVHAL